MANPLSQFGVTDRDFAAAVATAVGEAGNQGTIGMAAVVDVLNNRTQIDDFSSRFGTSIADQAMARAGREFNAWMPSDRTYATTKKVYDAALSGDDSKLSASEKKQMAKAVEATVAVLGSGPLQGFTEGADSYQNKKTTDEWGTSGPQDALGKLNGKFQIGDHTFTGHVGFGFTPGDFDRAAADEASARNSAWFNAPGAYDPLSSVTAKPNGTFDDTPSGVMAPGYNFSPTFSSLGFDPSFAQPVTPQNPPAATRGYDPLSSISSPSAAPGWGSIAGGAIANPTFATPRNDLPGASPDWGTGGLGGGFGDYTTGSNGTFQSAPPSTMSAAQPAYSGPTGATLAGDAISAARPVAGPLTPGYAFSSIKPKASAITAAVAAADEKAAAEAQSEVDRETARAKALGSLPQPDLTTATPVDPTAPKAPQVQKAMPRIAPRPIQPPHPPSIPMTQKALNAYGLGDSPGSQLAAQIGTPSQFMGSGTSPQNFAKALTAISAINGNNLANVYASQLSSERPGISGVAFDALQNQYAKATGQPQTKGLLSGLLGDIGQAFGSTPKIGFNNSPSPAQGMYVQGTNGPVWANFTDNQNAINNGTAGGWGSMGFGPGTSGLY